MCMCVFPSSLLLLLVLLLCLLITNSQEPSTCTYILKFHTPLLCEHAKFRKVETSFSYIQCNPISVGDGEKDGATQMSEVEQDNEIPTNGEELKKASSILATDHAEL